VGSSELGQGWAAPTSARGSRRCELGEGRAAATGAAPRYGSGHGGDWGGELRMIGGAHLHRESKRLET
jgi:hypothetical protein